MTIDGILGFKRWSKQRALAIEVSNYSVLCTQCDAIIDAKDEKDRYFPQFHCNTRKISVCVCVCVL